MTESSAEDKAKDLLNQMKNQNPVDYMSMIRAQYRQAMSDREELGDRLLKIEGELKQNKDKRDKMIQKLDDVTQSIQAVQKDLYYLENKKEKTALNYTLMERDLKSNLNEYIGSQKYETVKSILVKYKPKKKKVRTVNACIVFYFLDDVFEDKKKSEKASKDPNLKVPFIVAEVLLDSNIRCD